MPLTSDQIVEEVRRWPRAQATELLDRLAYTLQPEDPALAGLYKIMRGKSGREAVESAWADDSGCMT